MAALPVDAGGHLAADFQARKVCQALDLKGETFSRQFLEYDNELFGDDADRICVLNVLAKPTKGAISPSTGRIVPEGTPGSIVEYFKQTEYDRITTTGGYESDPVLSNEEAFDIF